MSIIDTFRRFIGNKRKRGDSAGINQIKPQENDQDISNIINLKKSFNETTIEDNISLSDDMTQFPMTKSDAPKQEIVIGLDFGTAFTKVIIGEVRKCYAVPFKNPPSKNSYLLPCILNVHKNGRCSLDNDLDVKATFSNLKMGILEGDQSAEIRIHIVAFLALVFRYSRFWFMNTHKKIYENRYLDWYVNVGLPTESYHDEKLAAEYRIIIMAAWALSILPEYISITRAKDFYSTSLCNKNFLPDCYNHLQQRLFHPDAIGLFPEFVAQINGYVRSPLRKKDLHLMVDVGAGTFDVSIFNVNDIEGENQFPIFAKAVKLLGTHYFMKHRLDKLQQSNDYNWTVHDNVPSKEEFTQATKCSSQKITEIDQLFHIKIGNVLKEQLQYTKALRYPGSPMWEEGIPTFLCGGGGKVDFYREIIKNIESNKNNFCKIKLQQLPKPERLHGSGLMEDEFELLSVAYGLSFNAFDIGQIILANKIEDISQAVTKKDFSDRYISKEMI